MLPTLINGTCRFDVYRISLSCKYAYRHPSCQSLPPGSDRFYHLHPLVPALMMTLSSLTTPALLILFSISFLFFSNNSARVFPSLRTTCKRACWCSLIPNRARPLMSIRLTVRPLETHDSAKVTRGESGYQYVPCKAGLIRAARTHRRSNVPVQDPCRLRGS